MFLNARINISSTAEGYIESSYTQNKTLDTVQHVLINGAALPAGQAYIASLTNLINTQYSAFPQLKSLIGSAWALLPPTSPYYPTAFANANKLTGQPLVLLFRSIPTGVRITEDITDNSRVVAGVRGTAMGWEYDTGFLYSENKLTNNLLQGWALTDKYLNLLNTGVINPFGPTTDPTALASAMASNYVGNFSVNKTSVSSLDAKASRDLYSLPAGMVSLAVGGELRKEKMDINPSAANRNFDVSGFGAPGVPVSAARNVGSAFAEVNLPILKNLEANVAVRYDSYEKVGNTVNPKGSIRWQPVESFLVRASVGTGFRAPTLLDLYQPEARGITTNGQRDRIRCPVVVATIQDCSNQFVTIGGGNPLLKPEKSKSTTLGFLFEPNKDYSLGMDGFVMALRDVIRTGVPIATILGDPVAYASYIHRGAPDGNASGAGPITGIDQSLTNLGRVNVAGLDIDVKGRVINRGENKVTLRLNGTYMARFDNQNLDGSFTSAINNPSALNIGVILRWRHTASATYERGPWVATLSENYQVGYNDLRTALQAASVAPRQVSSYQTFDAQLSYMGIKSTKLTLGIKNLTDRDPPYTNYGGGFVGSYDLSYTDVRGRFIYGTLAYAFK
ncbi:MAG: TonB-dependent receptor [Proteobacteria bacterium]|nr:TonB-dependent receptor [Pseudomonadota bacterium]